MAKKPAKPKAPVEPEKPKAGRPSKYTPELVEAICDRLAKGEPLAQICRDDGMPDPSTVWDWRKKHPEVSQAIAHARDVGFDAIADECFAIADDSRNDWMDRKAEEGDEKALQFNGEHVQRAKLRIETRLKLLAKWDPKRYGDRLAQEISGPNGGPIQTEGVTSPEERQKRIEELAMKLGMKLTPT